MRKESPTRWIGFLDCFAPPQTNDPEPWTSLESRLLGREAGSSCPSVVAADRSGHSVYSEVCSRDDVGSGKDDLGGKSKTPAPV